MVMSAGVVRARGGCMLRGRHVHPGGMCDLARHAGIHTPLWTDFLTHACENITFPQVVMRTIIINM